MSERLLAIYSFPGLIAGSAREDPRMRAAKLVATEKASRENLKRSMSHSALGPVERIHLWEILHRVQLPTNRDHALLFVIARSTGLSVEQVTAEQCRRRSNDRATSLRA